MLLDNKNCKAQKDHWNRIKYTNRSKYIGNLIYEIGGKRKIYLMNNAGIIGSPCERKQNCSPYVIQELNLRFKHNKIKNKNTKIKIFEPRRDLAQQDKTI